MQNECVTRINIRNQPRAYLSQLADCCKDTDHHSRVWIWVFKLKNKSLQREKQVSLWAKALLFLMLILMEMKLQ